VRDENAILATRIEIEPPPVEGGDVTVVLDGERRVRIAADDPRASGLRAVFGQLRDQVRPVYVDVDPATGTVTRLLLPQPTRVVRVEERGDELLVEVADSHAVQRLDLAEPGSADLAEVLRAALDSRGGVLLTVDDAHRIVDVVEYTPGPDGPVLPPFPEPPVRELKLPEPPFWRRWWLCFWWWWRCPSAATGQAIFDQLAATSCAPLTVPPPCIPFRYPDDGCWARAHEMCRLMINRGRAPRKVWIFQSPGHVLHVNTKNNPSCFVEWWYHVAPTLCVRTGKWWWPFTTTRMVMDPSMFSTPVPVATWHAAQHDPAASLVHTGPEQYGPNGGTDPAYSQTNIDLATYRTALLSRSLQAGPPPYANCP